MIDQSLVDSSVDETINILERYAIRLNGSPVDWRSLFELHRESLRLCDSEADFEERVSGVLARSGLSHTAFFRREDPQRVPARYAAAVTLAAFDADGATHWIFQDVREGGPAANAGITAGELLLAINGEEVRPPIPVTFSPDRDATLTIAGRDGQQRDVRLQFPQSTARGYSPAGTPPMARPRSVSASRIGDDTGYLRVAFFPGPSGREFAVKLSAALAQLGPVRRLLIDTRGNNGGFVGYLRLASYLTPGRMPVGYSLTKLAQDQGRKREDLMQLRRIPTTTLGEVVMFFRFHERDRNFPLRAGRKAFKPKDRSVSLWTEGLGAQPFHGRIVMLVNEDTYSAAETLAAFALEERLATLVGTRTAGQTNGGANYQVAGARFTLRLPATIWRTWRETSYEGIGITPHVIVAQSLGDLRAGVDTQLERAKAILNDM
jgi:carboxyl-terminal processing protease